MIIEARQLGRIFFRIVQERDLYGLLRSIHNIWVQYDHSKRWVTDQSIQKWDVENGALEREQQKQPVTAPISGAT